MFMTIIMGLGMVAAVINCLAAIWATRTDVIIDDVTYRPVEK